MKQANGWSKPPSRGGSNKGHRKNNGGSYSLKYQRNSNFRPPKQSHFFDTIKERLNFTFKNLAGQTVKLKKSDGLIIQGILIASNNESASGIRITLQYVKVLKRPEGNKEVLPTGNAKYVILWNDLSYVLGSDDYIEGPSTGKLKTDSDISSNIKAGKIAGRRLQAPDSSWLKKPKKPVDMNPKERVGAWDQFKVNEEKFGVKGTFKEEFYTTNLDKSVLTPEQIQNAKDTAKAIESKKSSNPHMREERNQKLKGADEETRYSAVIRNPPPQVKSNKPLNFAAALMKGKQAAKPPARERFQTPLKQQFKGTPKGGQEKNFKASMAGATGGGDDQGHPKNSKYKVSDVDFSALKKAAQFKRAMLTPSSKNWEAHNFTKKKIEAGKGKSREEQINEFKKFSSSLDTKKTKKSLNVNAKEFKPNIPPQVINNQEGQPPEQPDSKGKGKMRKNANSNVHVGAPGQPAYAQQQPMWTMPMHPQMPVNFYHPVMIPGGGVYPPNANGNIMLPHGQPYVVHMIPPNGMHPYQGQRFPQNFPPQVVQVGPGMQAVGNEQLTEAQKQMMHQQMQQAQQQQQHGVPQHQHQAHPPKQLKQNKPGS